MNEILIGIDDTDNPTSIGTGRLARNLCAELVGRGMKSMGVTRHQFLLDSAIPYTSHNSGACVAVSGKQSDEIINFVFDFIADTSAVGSDPGVCIALRNDLSKKNYEFGLTAQTEVLKIEQAFNTVRSTNIRLHGLGGNCQGVIGALASVALRASGNDGRFIDLPGIRELPRRLTYKELLEIGIDVCNEKENYVPGEYDICDTLDWVRPRLINGKPVLPLEWSDKDNAWIPVDRKKSKSS